MSEPTDRDHKRAQAIMAKCDHDHACEDCVVTAVAEMRERIMDALIAERAQITNGNRQTHDALTRLIAWLRAGAHE